MRVGSLFTGIGGIDLGFERAGFDIAWQCELDPFCRRVLAKHWPDVPCYEDVRELHGPFDSHCNSPDEDPGHLAAVDVLAGGFPCQPVSLAGKRQGQDDERWLWPEFARLVRELRPRYVVVENVPGLLVRGMGDVLGDLAACGFDAEWDSISAASVGAPHIRDRVFVVAYANGRGRVPSGERRGLARMDGAGPDDAGASAQSGVADPEGVSRKLRPSSRERLGRSASQRPALADSGRFDRERRRDARIVGGTTGAREGEAPERQWVWDAAIDRRADVADATRIRGRRSRQQAEPGCALADPEGLSEWTGLRASEPGSVGRGRLGNGGRSASPAGWRWEPEPDVGRVAHGVPSRVDRLRALGNAVVPQVAEVAAWRVREIEAEAVNA